MYSLRPVLWKQYKNKDGLYQLNIALTIDRKTTYFKTSFKLKENQWKDGQIVNYPNAKEANALLRKKISDIEKDILLRQMAGESVTVRSIKNPKSKSFKTFALEVKGDTIHNNKELNRLTAFKEDVLLSDITPEFLRAYERHERSRGMSQNTINTTFKWIRRIVRQAHKEKVIMINPMEGYIIPRYMQTDRVYLNEEDKKKLMDKLDPGYPFYNTLAYSLMSCYTGLRQQDWINVNANRIDGDFFRLRAKKNKQLVVLPIGPTLKKILDIVLRIGKPYSLNICNKELKIIAKDCGINKHLTCHVFRHSFAYMCAKNKIPKSVTAELMGISDKVVEVYYHLEGSDIAEQAAALKAI